MSVLPIKMHDNVFITASYKIMAVIYIDKSGPFPTYEIFLLMIEFAIRIVELYVSHLRFFFYLLP